MQTNLNARADQTSVAERCCWKRLHRFHRGTHRHACHDRHQASIARITAQLSPPPQELFIRQRLSLAKCALLQTARLPCRNTLRPQLPAFCSPHRAPDAVELRVSRIADDQSMWVRRTLTNVPNEQKEIEAARDGRSVDRRGTARSCLILAHSQYRRPYRATARTASFMSLRVWSRRASADAMANPCYPRPGGSLSQAVVR